MFGYMVVDSSVNLHQKSALWVSVSNSAKETGVVKPYSLLDELQHHVVSYISCEDL